MVVIFPGAEGVQVARGSSWDHRMNSIFAWVYFWLPLLAMACAHLRHGLVHHCEDICFVLGINLIVAIKAEEASVEAGRANFFHQLPARLGIVSIQYFAWKEFVPRMTSIQTLAYHHGITKNLFQNVQRRPRALSSIRNPGKPG